MIERMIEATVKGAVRIGITIGTGLAYVQLLLLALFVLGVLGVIGVLVWQWIA